MDTDRLPPDPVGPKTLQQALERHGAPHDRVEEPHPGLHDRIAGTAIVRCVGLVIFNRAPFDQVVLLSVFSNHTFHVSSAACGQSVAHWLAYARALAFVRELGLKEIG